MSSPSGALTVLRNIGFRAVMRVPALDAYFREAKWLHATGYRRSPLSRTNGNTAVGQQLPQHWGLPTGSG